MFQLSGFYCTIFAALCPRESYILNVHALPTTGLWVLSGAKKPHATSTWTLRDKTELTFLQETQIFCCPSRKIHPNPEAEITHLEPSGSPEA